jgi:pyridoxamine 5'-phosphate oxidase
VSLHLAAPTDELPTQLDALWRELGRAVNDKHHAWRTPVLATVRTAGEVTTPEARTVVLREVNADARQLLLYTDTRSRKVAQISANPNATLLFWSPQKHWQLRVRATVALLSDATAVAERWQRVKDCPSAGDYLSHLAPGQAIGGEAHSSSDAEAQPHFGILVATATHFDWLELARSGHRRAGFDLSSGEASWLVP